MPENLLTFVVVLSAVTLVPGPNVIVVVRNALTGGIFEGIRTIFGNLIALLTMALLAAFGVGSLFLAYPPSLTVVRVIGAAYLLYVAWKLFNSGRANLAKDNVEMLGNAPAARNASLQDGLFVSFSNPKAILFLMSIFPQHIDPAGNRVQQFVILFVILACIVFTIHFSYAVFGSMIRKSGQFGLVLAITNLTASALLVVFSGLILLSTFT